MQDFNTPAGEPPATVDLDFKANRIPPKHLPTMDVKLLLPLAAALAVLIYAPPSEGKNLLNVHFASRSRFIFGLFVCSVHQLVLSLVFQLPLDFSSFNAVLSVFQKPVRRLQVAFKSELFEKRKDRCAWLIIGLEYIKVVVHISRYFIIIL